MDKIRKQKLDYFLLDLDGKIKEIRNYFLLDKGSILLDAIEKFEEENAEFLQYYSSGQDELNKRKWIIQYVLFPILDDDKIEELLQYHLLEALEAGLDVEELMQMRAITISELLWPKISQQYLKSLMQNTQLIGGDPISMPNSKTSLLPYVKNWINLYNQRFGVDKHSGLEPHQFILEDPNTRRLSKGIKENLLKILNFYESLKVYSLSEIEAELRKMQMGFATQQAAAYSLSKQSNQKTAQNLPPNKIYPASKEKVIPNPVSQKSAEKIISTKKDSFQDKRIKIVTTEYPDFTEKNNSPTPNLNENNVSKNNVSQKRESEAGHILELLEKYPALGDYRITDNPISLPIAPFSLPPTVQNWIQYYYNECGKGRHSPQEREGFLNLLRKSQHINELGLQKIHKIFRSVDDKTPLPFDKASGELLLDSVKVGQKLKAEEEKNVDTKIKPVGIMKSQAGRSDYLNLELVPTNPANLGTFPMNQPNQQDKHPMK